MDLIQIIIELRHSEPLRLFRPYEELFRSITEKQLSEKEIPLPGFELNISEKRMRVLVEPKRTAITLGDVPTISYCVDNIMGVFKKISSLVELPPLIRLGERSYWIEESNLDFKELVSTYKRILYKSSSIVKDSVDVGVSFTLKNGECAANVAFGPMELSQLKTMFVFKPTKLPKVVTFLDVDYYFAMEPSKVTEKTLRDFLYAGLNYSSEQSQKLASILGKEE